MQPIDRIEHIKNWIFNYVVEMPNPANCLVVGISGGIDSSVVSTISAMTGLKTLVVCMPIHQRPEQHDLSVAHKNWLINKFKNAYAVEVDLTYVFNAFENSLTDLKFTSQLGLANSRARLRMMCLYQIAASCNGIVVGTGNKVEDFGVGFFTKYGDGGVDISPIGDCLKTDVWKMGKELKILDEIIMADPTDGLWSDGRTDIDQLGMSYKELEIAMQDPSDKNYTKYLELRIKNLHKMKSIPVCKFDGKTTLETDKK